MMYSQSCWIVSCRSRRSLDEFSKRVLIFQPDIRNFCIKGEKCPLIDDEWHCALCTHEVRTKDTSKTTVFNSNNASPRIPRIPHAWEIGRDLSMDFTGIPENKTVVLFVHGFSESYSRILSYLDHLNRNEIVDNQIVRVGFVWPSNSLSYFRARVFAEYAAKKLRHAIQLFGSRGNKIVLLGHSMGARVCLHALHGSLRIETLVLLGAAVAADSLSESGQFPASGIRASNIKVLYSSRDTILKQMFPFVELLPGILNFRPVAGTNPMGILGATGELDGKVININCSSQVGGHSTHLYLNSEKSMSHIRQSIFSTLLKRNNKL